METAVSVCCLAISNSTEKHPQMEAYISQPAFTGVDGLSQFCNLFIHSTTNSVALSYTVSLAFLSKTIRRLITKCLHLAPVVQRVDSAIQGITQQVLAVFIR